MKRPLREHLLDAAWFATSKHGLMLLLVVSAAVSEVQRARSTRRMIGDGRG